MRYGFPRAAAMACIAFLLVSALVAVRSGPVPPMDDTYIHLVYGRSILRGQPLQFNPGTPSSGFTSPLWLAAAAAAAPAGTEWAPAVLMALSAVAGCAAVLLSGAGPAPLFLLLLGPLLFHGSSGMETALACLAVVLVWRRLESGGEPDLRGGLLLAGAILVRPELALLAVPLALGAGRPKGRQLAALLWPPLAAGGLWMAWNLYATGLPLPSTFYAKQAGAAAYGLLPGLRGLARNLALGAPLLVPAGGWAAFRLLRRRDPLGLVPALTLIPALLLQPNAFFQLRYHVPWLAAFALAAGRMLAGRRWPAALVALSLVPGMLLFASRRVRAADDVEAIDVRPAQLLRREAPRGSTVAAADVGAMGWVSGLRVLDLDGLVTPRALREGRDWDWVAARADYLAAFPRQYSDLVESAADRLVPMARFESPSPVICGEESVAVWRVEGSD